MLSRRVASSAAARQVAARCACGRSVHRLTPPAAAAAAAAAAVSRQARTFVTADDAKILADRKAASREPRKIERFKDFTGRWHESKTVADHPVMEDRQLSDEMRYYNSIVKGAGASLWLAVVGVEFNLLGKAELIDYASIPGGLPWLACGGLALTVTVPTTIWASLTLRRQLERQAFRISVPSVVALTAERPEVELSARNKDFIAGVYNWVMRDALERKALGTTENSNERQYVKELQSAAPVSDLASHSYQLKVEAERRAELPAAEQSLPCAVAPLGKDKPSGGEGELAATTVELLQFDLLDKMRQELLRPLSGIRAELQLPAIITVIERERIERVAAALAPDPKAAADLQMFLRWFSRTQKLFTVEKALEESPIDWWSYDAWGEEPPERPEERRVESVVITQNRWIGSQEVVEVDTTIPVEEQAVPEMAQLLAATAEAEDGNGEDVEVTEDPDVAYAEGTVGDFFKVYDLQPPFGGTYKPEEYYVDKPVFEPLAKNKVANKVW
jgi:hypothetical protein